TPISLDETVALEAAPSVAGGQQGPATGKRRVLALLVVGLGGLVMLSGLLFLLLPGPASDKIKSLNTQTTKPTGQTSQTEPEKTFTNSIGMSFVLVPRGKFLMGGAGGQLSDTEVEIPHDFYLGKYEVTQGEWELVMQGQNPSYFTRTSEGKAEVAN